MFSCFVKLMNHTDFLLIELFKKKYYVPKHNEYEGWIDENDSVAINKCVKCKLNKMQTNKTQCYKTPENQDQKNYMCLFVKYTCNKCIECWNMSQVMNAFFVRFFFFISLEFSSLIVRHGVKLCHTPMLYFMELR